jgi:4-hydroxy-tetrahydrodipicolinate synthase
LFAEPSPSPAKYWLWRTGLIESAEVRLPMVAVSQELAGRLDEAIARRSATRDLAPGSGLVNAR